MMFDRRVSYDTLPVHMVRRNLSLLVIIMLPLKMISCTFGQQPKASDMSNISEFALDQSVRNRCTWRLRSLGHFLVMSDT